MVNFTVGFMISSSWFFLPLFLVGIIAFTISFYHYVFGVTYLEMLAEYNDPDYEMYRNNPAHWIEEIHQYMERLNETMTPICCKQFPG